MRLSRDEAREVVAIALMLAIGLRFLSGTFRWLDERRIGADRGTLIATIFEPVGTTMGMLVVGLAALIVLSPKGAVSTRVHTVATWTSLAVMVGGVIVILNRLVAGGGSILGRIWFSLFDKFPAVILAGAAWTILSRLDPDR